MLFIQIPEQKFEEGFDERSNTFLPAKPTLPPEALLLEHSLVSLSKWESLTKKPFLDGKPRTTEETQLYVSCMNLAPVSSEKVYSRLTDADINAISAYIDDANTATWFKPDPNARKSGEIITSEVIYYWMIAHSIPKEHELWHLNRLLTLIKVCNEKNKPARRSKMGSRDLAASRRALNDQRLAAGNTHG